MNNFFHKTWRFGLLKVVESYSDDDYCIYRLTHSVNIVRKLILGFNINVSGFGLDWSASFIIFNWNGSLIYGKI